MYGVCIYAMIIVDQKFVCVFLSSYLLVCPNQMKSL